MENGKYFLQFITSLKNEKKEEYYSLTNGFSDAYSICKEIGEFIWIDQSSDQHYDRKHLIEEFDKQDQKFPISAETVYISAMQIFHIYQAYRWAQHTKDTKFVVGGPAVDSGFLNFDGVEKPLNLELSNISVEQYFGNEDFSGEWGLDVKAPKEKPILFTYSLDNYCYWGKCVFCKYPQQTCKMRIKNKPQFEFEHVAPERKKTIWLQTNCLTPKRIKQILPNLPNNENIEYIMFVRGTPAERRALEEISDITNFDRLNLYMGIEFPSDRMLSWIRKGVTCKDYIQFLKTTEKLNINMTMSYILGWDILQESDIDDVERFINQMPENNLNLQKIFLLTVAAKTELYNYCDKTKLKPITCGPFTVGYNLELNKEQALLNERVRKLILSNKYRTLDRYNFGKGVVHEWAKE